MSLNGLLCACLTSPLDGVGVELNAPAVVPPGMHRTGVWLEHGDHPNAIVTRNVSDPAWN
jgi:hypothetical protein